MLTLLLTLLLHLAVGSLATPVDLIDRATAQALPRKLSSVPQNLRAAAGSSTLYQSSNWAAVVKQGKAITQVTGTFVVPTIQIPSSAPNYTTYGASAWVGIDGWSCKGTIFQTGVDFIIKNGVTQYGGWYEWLPGFAYSYNNFAISAGDTIRASVSADTSTTGTAMLENLTTGQNVSNTYTTASNNQPLCGTSAEWVIEDYPMAGSTAMVPFVDWGAVSFKKIAYTAGGVLKKSVTNPITVRMAQKKQIMATCKLGAPARVDCTYLTSV